MATLAVEWEIQTGMKISKVIDLVLAMAMDKEEIMDLVMEMVMVKEGITKEMASAMVGITMVETITSPIEMVLLVGEIVEVTEEIKQISSNEIQKIVRKAVAWPVVQVSQIIWLQHSFQSIVQNLL